MDGGVWRTQRSYTTASSLKPTLVTQSQTSRFAKARIVSFARWVATAITGKGSFGEKLWTHLLLSNGRLGYRFPDYAMFEDNDEDYYINTQGFKAFEYLQCRPTIVVLSRQVSRPIPTSRQH
jgi:hypothetical protein